MWLFGRYVADGYVDLREGRGGTVTISVGEEKFNRDGPILEALGFKGRKVRTAWNFDKYDRGLASFLHANFGVKAANKVVPSWLMGAPSVDAFIKGYVDGDGHRDHRSTACATASKSLAIGLKMLLVGEGYHPVLLRREQHCDVIEGRRVNVQPWSYIVRWENNKSQRTGLNKDGTSWTLVKSVDPVEGEPVPVYNLEVEEDHTYIADGIAVCNCTNHSLARGVSRKKQDATLFDQDFDPVAERSRATMWDVPRFAEVHHYAAIVVENVVEAVKWVLWPAWWESMELLGYKGRVLSHNSQDHGVAQSRDRIYVVWTKKGIEPDLEMERDAVCGWCERSVVCRQAWKPDRWVGRYRQQWFWACIDCGREVQPSTAPAAEIIDWSLPAPTVGERKRPLSKRTRERIAAGLERYGWARRPDRMLEYREDALLMRNNSSPNPGYMSTPVTEPARTMTTTGHQSLLLPYYGQSQAVPVTRPIGTQTTRDTHALIDMEDAVDDCGFRMLEPHEVSAAMAFPEGYIPNDLPKKDQIMLAGNAVVPPVATWTTGRIIQALEEV